MIDSRVRPISIDEQNRRLHTLPVWARDRIRNAEDDLAAALAPKERPESEAAQAIEVVRGFLRRVTHWQEGKPDCHDAMEALDSADDDVDWIEHGIVEWREVALKAQADLAAARAQYNELIMAVAQKHPNESRHETALRYIRQAEQNSLGDTGSKLAGKDKP